MTAKRRTAWLYWFDKPIQSVLVTDDMMTDDDVRRKMNYELDVCPGVFCERFELPFERRNKIAFGEIRYA